MSSNAPVRVLQIIDSLGMGGAETWLMEVLRLWSKSGVGQVDFMATSGKTGVFDEEARSLGANIHYNRYGRTQLQRFARQFRQVLRSGNYAAIHDHQDYVSGWHFLLGAGVLPPVRVTHVHNPAYQILNNYGVTPMRRLTAHAGKSLVARYATHITGTSRQAITEYGFDDPSFERIPKAALHCGFSPARFLGDVASSKRSVCQEFGWPEDAKVILFAGRIDQCPDSGHPQNHKNSGFALSVGIEAARRDPRIRMLFVGAISASVPVLEQRVAVAGLNGQIHFAGIRKDVERFMLASNVLLFPSRGEGLGMVSVEAQSAGLPVLASTAVPRESVVIPELVRFLELEAGATQWATTLLELITQGRNVGSANRRVAASGFAIENSASALYRLYGGGLPH